MQKRYLVDGTNTTVDVSTDGEVAIDASGGGGGVSDGDKGDIVVSASGTVWTIDGTGTILNKADKATSINTTAPLQGGGTLAATRTLTVDTATTTAVGVVELATNAETTTGSDTARAVTPAGLHQKTASTTAIGLVELATDAEAVTGTDTTRAVTPANLTAAVVTKALYDANTILAATADNTPVALTVGASRIVGRKASGDIAAMTGAETYALLTRTREIFYSVPGTLTTGGGAIRIPFPRAATITNVAAVVGTAPTGAAIRIDVNKNGTTIFTTQGNRPDIAVSTNADNTATPDVTSIAANDYLTVDIDVVGSSVAGADLTVRIDYTEVG